MSRHGDGETYTLYPVDTCYGIVSQFTELGDATTT
jgi:hypothetical protein